MTSRDDEFERIQEEAIRSSWTMNHVKGKLRSSAIWDVLFFLAIVLIFFAFNLVPWKPPTLFDYGLVIHAGHIGWWALVLSASGSISTWLFGATVLCGIFMVIFDTWAFLINIGWFIGCIIGSGAAAIDTCGASALYRIALMVISAILLYYSVTIVLGAYRGFKFLQGYSSNTRLSKKKL